MKRIIIVSQGNLAYGNTAASARMKNYAQALALVKSNIVYLISYKEFNNQLIELHKNIYAFNKNNSKQNKISITTFFLFLNRFIKSIKEEVVIIYYPVFNPTFEFFTLIFFKLINKRQIYCEINEIRKYDSTLNTKGIRGFIIKCIFALLENTARLYNGLICISDNIAKYYESKNKNIIVIPILSDNNRPFCFKHVNNSLIFAFTGSVSFEKENLYEVFLGFEMLKREYSRFQFNLYGPISKNDKIKFDNLVKKLDLSNNVFYRGVLPHSEIYNVLQNADCLLLTRKNSLQNFYGFSTKLSEYAVSGTPVLLTNTGVIEQFFKDGYNCLMTNGYSAKDFYIKFKEFIIMNNDEKEAIAYNAYETSLKYFCWENYSEKIDSFLK